MELVEAKKKENADINDAQSSESDEYTVKKTELSENIAKKTGLTAARILELVNEYIDEKQHERKRKNRTVPVVTPESPSPPPTPAKRSRSKTPHADRLKTTSDTPADVTRPAASSTEYYGYTPSFQPWEEYNRMYYGRKRQSQLPDLRRGHLQTYPPTSSSK